MTAPPSPGGAGTRGRSLSAVLFHLAHDNTRDRISIADLLGALSDRALGALMFIFAAPNILPVPPGVSAVLGAPLVLLSAQLMLGLRPWLPTLVTKRSITRDDFASLMRRVLPWLTKAEKLLRPRIGVLTRPPVEYAVGFICLFLAVILVLPVPLGNNLPALSISLLALGVLERDGYWVLAGLASAVVATAVVSGVIFALVKATLFIVTQSLS